MSNVDLEMNVKTVMQDVSEANVFVFLTSLKEISSAVSSTTIESKQMCCQNSMWRSCRRPRSTGPLVPVHMIRPLSLLVWHSTGHWISRTLFIFLKKLKYFKVLIMLSCAAIFLSGPPKFDPNHMTLSVTGPDGSPTFKA